MQNHPPDKNNPSNPLVKVAALTVDKEYLEFTPKSAVKVLITLNFKRSADMRGRTTTPNGESATVTFSLALRRASLELAFAFERAPEDVVKLERVAYVSTLHSKEKVSDMIVAQQDTQKSASGAFGVSAKVGTSAMTAAGHVDGSLSAGIKSKTTKKRKATRAVSRSNVSATVGGNIVHWEISPNMLSNNDVDGESWLDGELFKASTGRSMDACLAIWQHDEERGVPTITASVFVSMADLIVGEVKVLSDIGEEISIRHFDDAQGLKAVYNRFDVERVKERFVRQVIRKHLSSQGMSVEGARVQISKASA
jgi:hypothetical protein